MTDRPQVLVDAGALNALLNFVVQAHLPMGRDALVQAVLETVRPASVAQEEDGTSLDERQEGATT